jgi:hypothetical protein
VIDIDEINNYEEIKEIGIEETPSFPNGIGRRIPEEKASPKKLIKSHKDHIVMSGVSGPRPAKGSNQRQKKMLRQAMSSGSSFHNSIGAPPDLSSSFHHSINNNFRATINYNSVEMKPPEDPNVGLSFDKHSTLSVSGSALQCRICLEKIPL